MNVISTEMYREFGLDGQGSADGGITYRMEYIPTSEIDAHPDNRELDAAYVEELAESILNDGLGQLPTVREVGGCRYQTISGHHRIAAHDLLAERTGDESWRMVPCTIVSGLDDDQTKVMLYLTNLTALRLTPEQEGEAYEAIASVVAARRRKDPKKYKNVKASEVIAELSTAQGRQVSPRTVERRLQAHRRSNGAAARRARRFDEAEAAVDALLRAVERLEDVGRSDPKALARKHDTIMRYAKRARAAANRSRADGGAR